MELNKLSSNWLTYQFEGIEFLDFLKRLSTQIFDEKNPKFACFLDSTGKIQSFFYFDPGSFQLSFPKELKDSTIKYLEKFQITEDFSYIEVGFRTIQFPKRDLDDIRNKELSQSSDLIFQTLVYPKFEVYSNYTPMDLGLDFTITRKGCFPGQEVLEKISSRNAHPKALCIYREGPINETTVEVNGIKMSILNKTLWNDSMIVLKPSL